MRRSPLLLRLAIASLVIGGFALVRNLFSTFTTLQDYPNASFLPVFLSTQGASGVSPVLVFFVWGPLVFGLLGAALLVTHVVTTRARGAQQQQGWQQPQQQAWQQPQQGQQPQQQWQQPQPSQQPAQQGPVQPLGGQQPPPPDASDRIQP